MSSYYRVTFLKYNPPRMFLLLMNLSQEHVFSIVSLIRSMYKFSVKHSSVHFLEKDLKARTMK